MRSTKNQQLGTVKRHPDGFGFFVPDDTTHPDVYIPKHEMNGVMSNDRVTIRTHKEAGVNRYRGDIIKINERGTKTVVGKYTVTPKGQGMILDDGKGWGADMKLEPPKTGALTPQVGEWVAAEILSYPNEGRFEGKITQIIGALEDPMTDIERVALTQHLPMKFSPQTLREAQGFPEKVPDTDFRNRKNLRQLNFVTIDGATAKDFDDAIFVELKDDGFKLYVAIADVSHYVKVGSAIDRDAYDRGTSVYFPHFVIPMLPEVLSNGLCSLNPHVPRLALVADMDFDFTGEMTKSTFYEAVIESKARITYGEAQEIIEGVTPKHFGHVEAAVKRAGDLAKVLMAYRSKNGSLDLDLPEVQILVDEGGIPTDIVKSERLFSHRLIEEMMLAANVAVAKFLADKNVPCLYRIHDPPKPEALQMLEKYLRQFGGRVKFEGGSLQKKLTKALQEFQGKPEALVLNTLTLRSMMQAKYSENNVGHFGLGFQFYAHFTSPIRRYPDLIVHRLVKSQILRNSQYKTMSEDELSTAGVVLSACEQRAVKAERQVQGIKKARYMEKFINQEFDGVISSITRFGAFVTLRTIEVDGLVHIDNMSRGPEDRMIFDEEKLRLVSRRSGFSYSIGDTIRVRVDKADIESGQIDFMPVRASKSKERPHQAQQPVKQKGSAKEQDVLDLDAMEIEETSFAPEEPRGKQKLIFRFEPPPKNTHFDPSAHLDRLLKKRQGDTPPPATNAEEPQSVDREGRPMRRATDFDSNAPSDRRNNHRSGRSKGPKKSSRRKGGLQGRVSHKKGKGGKGRR